MKTSLTDWLILRKWCERRTMVGYGIGYIAQGSTYNFMGAYFVIFLTNSVGLDSAMALSLIHI